MAPVMMKKTFFTELHHIVHIKLPANEGLHLNECEEVFLALVKTYKAEQDECGYWRYSNLRGFEFIDLTMIECTVGRLYDRDAWYIIDRNSQTLQ